MKEEKKITQSDIEKAVVRLHPMAGVSPRIYLPAAYILLAALLLFLVLVLPGMRKNGSYVVFDGAPIQSAVLVGDSYKGSSEKKIFLPKGNHEVRIEHEGFTPETRKLKVGGKLFGSLFFPRTIMFEYTLKADKPGQFLDSAYREYATWSLSGKPSALYQIPSVLSDAAAALAGTGSLIAAIPDASGFARDVLSATVSAESAKDGLKASILVVSGGLPGPLSMVAAARLVAFALGTEKSGAVWLQDILPKSRADAFALAPVAKAASAANGTDIMRPLGSISLGGHDFVLFPGSSLRMGGEAPSGSLAGYALPVPAFGIARTEVTNRQWAAFLAANSDWRADRRNILIEKGLVDESYLTNWPGADEEPVTNVSWHAASAFCEWLSSRMGGAYKVVLPGEGMWETAARAGLTSPNSLLEKKATWSDAAQDGPARVGAAGYSAAGIADLFGNVWEWTADAYRPYPAFADNLLLGDEKTVRGGSWANSPDAITLYSRGGMPSAQASTFLGFRPAIVER
jgi:iron(II)-dependent oxidoreductase